MFANNNGAKQYTPGFLGNVFLVAGGIAILLAMVGWLCFLGWLGWHFVAWILT
jgi:hypothetical protein